MAEMNLSAKEIYEGLCPKCKAHLEKMISEKVEESVKDVVDRTLGKAKK